jgi:uncharacterized repeat protein (TIGR01451 family)
MNPARRVRAKTLLRGRLSFVVFAVLLFATAASAQTNVYTMRGTSGSNNNIWSVNLSTGVETRILTGYPGGNAASLAQRPSDGMLFYAINGTNGAVYRFNPATPNVAPVAIGNLGPTASGADVSGGFRMTFNSNTLYYMVGNAGTDANLVYTVDQNNGRANPVATVTDTNNGGDIAFLGNTLYIIDQDLRLCSYAGLPANGAAGNCNTISIANSRSIGIAFSAGGQLLLQTVNSGADTSNLYSVTIPGLSVSPITALSGAGQATGDMAGANVPPPNLSITKTDGLSTVYRGGPVSYSIVVTNNGTYPVTGAVTDNVPATVTGVTWNCAATAPSFCAAASGSGNNINTSATLEAGASATYTVTGTLSATASGTLTNTANVAVPSWLTDSNPANNTASDSDTIDLSADLGITKTDGLANVTPGSAVTYSIVVSNAGPDTSNGSIVTDTVPASITGVTWTCGAPTGGATCGTASGSGNAISTTANLPSGSSVTYTVLGTLSSTATGTLSNSATVITPASGVSDPTDLGRTGAGNNSATDNTTISPMPIVNLIKSVSPGGNQSPGTDLAYTINFSNTGSLAASNFVITDPIPASTDFKIGSMTNALGTTGLTVTLAYSNNGGTTYVYTPASGAGGAPAGYDRLVTNVRWTFTGNLSQTPPNNAGSVGFTTRIR